MRRRENADAFLSWQDTTYLRTVSPSRPERGARAGGAGRVRVFGLGQYVPADRATCTSAWERCPPFLQFPPTLRRVTYTTNSIESLTFQLRKVTRNPGHFPTLNRLSSY